MSATLQELAAAGCSVNISAQELLNTISLIRMEEREAALADQRRVKPYTIADVVRLTGLTKDGVRKAIRRGTLPTVQPLGEQTTVYVPCEAVDNIINQLRHGVKQTNAK